MPSHKSLGERTRFTTMLSPPPKPSSPAAAEAPHSLPDSCQNLPPQPPLGASECPSTEPVDPVVASPSPVRLALSRPPWPVGGVLRCGAFETRAVRNQKGLPCAFSRACPASSGAMPVRSISCRSRIRAQAATRCGRPAPSVSSDESRGGHIHTSARSAAARSTSARPTNGAPSAAHEGAGGPAGSGPRGPRR
jgi:hypothetical protein